MAVTNGWGQGVINNVIEWGKGAINNTNSWGAIYADSYSGDTALTALTANLLLDQYSGAAAAYSVRKLSSSYSGSALRVRRSSDNAEQDIGFDGNDLDTSALTTFVGANNGFVVTWYDQSGSGNDATKATASQQPQIVSSGTLVSQGSKAALSFGTTTNLSLSSSVVTDNQAIFTVFDNATDITNATSLKFLLDASNGLLTFGSSSGTVANERVYWAQKSPTASVGENTTNIPAGQHVLSMLYNTVTFDTMFRDGVEYTLTDGSFGGFNGSNRASGYNVIGRSTSSLNDDLQEIIIYESDQSANRAAIESNINTYYDIYWDGTVSDPDAQAYLDEVVAQGGSLTNEVADEYNAFVLREKAASRYSKIKRLYPYLGGVIDSARIDAVTRVQATNNNFVDADVDSLIGVTPDGSTKSMVDSPVNSIINSVVGSQFGAFLKGATITNPTTFPAYYLGQLNTGIPSYFGAYKNASNTTSNGYSGGNAAIGNISSSGSNVSVIAARYSLSSAYMIVDGSEGSEQTITVGSGITTNTLKLFAAAVNTSSPSNYTSQPINTLFVSQFDTLQETKDFESSYKTFLTNIGAI